MTKDILLALRARLQAADYQVFLGKVVDPNQDQLPLVVLHFGKDGEKTTSTQPMRRKSLDILAEYICDTTTDDPLLELVDHGEALEAALVKPADCSGRDTLEGYAISVEHKQTVLISHDEWSDIGMAQVAITVNFLEV